MIPKGSTRRQMLEALAAAGGSLPKVSTGKPGDTRRLSEMVSAGLVRRVYQLTEAGREALANADKPAPHLWLIKRRKPKQDVQSTTNMIASLPWPRHPPITDPSAIAQIEQEAREARSL